MVHNKFLFKTIKELYKSFQKIWHNDLICKLEQNGIDMKVLIVLKLVLIVFIRDRKLIIF